MKEMENKKLKINKSVRGISAGKIVSIKTVKGIPNDPYWRRRLKDAKTDQCVEIVEEIKLSKLKKKEVIKS